MLERGKETMYPSAVQESPALTGTPLKGGEESPSPLKRGKEVASAGSATAMESDIPTVFYPDKHAKVYFPKGSTKVILEYTEITDNKVHIEFDSVSQCVNYCQNRGMDPLICDCKTMEEGGAR